MRTCIIDAWLANVCTASDSAQRFLQNSVAHGDRWVEESEIEFKCKPYSLLWPKQLSVHVTNKKHMRNHLEVHFDHIDQALMKATSLFWQFATTICRDVHFASSPKAQIAAFFARVTGHVDVTPRLAPMNMRNATQCCTPQVAHGFAFAATETACLPNLYLKDLNHQCDSNWIMGKINCLSSQCCPLSNHCGKSPLSCFRREWQDCMRSMCFLPLGHHACLQNNWLVMTTTCNCLQLLLWLFKWMTLGINGVVIVIVLQMCKCQKSKACVNVKHQVGTSV